MLKQFFLILQAFSTDSFSISNDFKRDDTHLYLPLNFEDFFIVAKKDAGYREISQLKLNLTSVMTHISDADTNNKQLIALQTSIKHSIKIIEENNLKNIIFEDTFHDEVKHNIVAIIHNKKCVANNGMNEYLLKSSLQKLENQNFFNINFQDGEVFGFKANNLSIIIQSEEKLNKNIYLQIEFKIYWLNSLLSEHELNLTLENRIKDEVEKSKFIENKLFQSEKLASMGEMIGNIAHQWRQPLSVISTASSGMLFQKEYDMLTDELFYKSCKTIDSNAQFLSKTIDNFRDFIKSDSTVSTVKIENITTNFLNLIYGDMKNNKINIITDIEKNIMLKVSENNLIQSLLSIFNNAKDVFINQNVINRLFFITIKKDTNKILIKLKDNAGGIKKDIINKVFEPYFTTKHKSQGTGLGLHSTHKIITDNMNGLISVNNVVYEHEDIIYNGAEFEIQLYC